LKLTKKLYWNKPYEIEFEARVTSIIENNKIVLDQTLFYPEGGGQLSDKGKLEKDDIAFTVLNVTKENDDIIHHISQDVSDKLKVGDTISGKIDWEYRYGIMKAHSAQHLFSAILKNNYNIDTAHANITFEEVSLQLVDKIFDDHVFKIFNELNEICTQSNLKFDTYIASKKSKENLKDLRGKIPDSGDIRIVSVKNYDKICCGGTHVENSVEIGPVFLYDYKKGTDFKFKVGKSALDLITRINIGLLEYSGNVNISISKVPDYIRKQLNLVEKLNQDTLDLSKKLLETIAEHPSATRDDLSIGYLELDLDMKELFKNFKKFPKQYLLIIKRPELKLLVLSNSAKANANVILQDLLKKYGGKGGGNPRSAQGTLESEPDDILNDIEL